jgi:CrcB protein
MSERLLRRAETVVLVAIGGFVGANSRYLVGLFAPGLPGTLVANVTGSFLLGFVVYEAAYTNHLSERGRLVLTTGFLSSYTTYSTFALETVRTAPLLGVANVGGNYAFGLAGVLLGRWVARRGRGEMDG